MAVYYAAKNEFEKSNQYFRELSAVTMDPSTTARIKQLYAWALMKQGKIAEALFQLGEAQNICENAVKRFSHVNIQPGLATLIRPELGQMFYLRLDLVNVSRSQGSIVKIENLLSPGLEVMEMPSNCVVHDGLIELKDNIIKPFELKTVKLAVKATKPQEFQLTPTVTYIDDLGETKTCSTRTFTMTVSSNA
jgi:hypothetical protein